MTKLQRALYFKERQEREQLARKAAKNQMNLTADLVTQIIGFTVLQEHIALCINIIVNPVSLVLSSSLGVKSIISIKLGNATIGCYYFYSGLGSYVGQSITLPKRVSGHILGHVKGTLELVGKTFATETIKLELYVLPKDVDIYEISQINFLFLLEFILIYKFIPTANINYLPSPGMSPAASTLVKLRLRGKPVYVYCLINGNEVLVYTAISNQALGPLLGFSNRWGLSVITEISGVYKNLLFISHSKLPDRKEVPISIESIKNFIVNGASSTIKRTTNVKVESTNLVTGEVSHYTILEAVLFFKVSVISIINDTETLYNGENYSLKLVSSKKSTSIPITSESTRGSRLYVYKVIDGTLTLIFVFSKIKYFGYMIGFGKNLAFSYITNKKGWYREDLFISKTLLDTPKILVTEESLRKILS